MSRPEFTIGIKVQHLPDRSDAENHAYAYTITIRNTGNVKAQLVARHWVITDAAGHVDEVRGLAVVGHQPLLAPGEQFEYTSWARIATPHGTMKGTYYCMTEDAQPFEAPIPEFALARSEALH
jgi:ApaG protein